MSSGGCNDLELVDWLPGTPKVSLTLSMFLISLLHPPSWDICQEACLIMPYPLITKAGRWESAEAQELWERVSVLVCEKVPAPHFGQFLLVPMGCEKQTCPWRENKDHSEDLHPYLRKWAVSHVVCAVYTVLELAVSGLHVVSFGVERVLAWAFKGVHVTPVILMEHMPPEPQIPRVNEDQGPRSFPVLTCSHSLILLHTHDFLLLL